MNLIPDCYYRTSIKALVLDEAKKFLLIQEADGKWELPGGGLEFGETPHDCLRREIKEEMGVEVINIDSAPSYFLSQQNLKFQWVTNAIYLAELKSLDFIPSDECIAVKFFTREEATKELTSINVTKFLDQFDVNKH